MTNSLGRTGLGTKQVPIESLKEGDLVVTYNNSHVYKTGRAVSAVRTKQFDGELIVVTAANGKRSEYTPDHHCIVRFSHESGVDKRHAVYLMGRAGQYRIGKAPLFYASQMHAMGPSQRASCEKADSMWILSVHDTNEEALLQESVLHAKYGIPSMCFESTKNSVIDIDEFWRRIGSNADRAERCLTDFGRMMEHPFWVPERRTGSVREFVTVAANLIDGIRVLELDKAPSDPDDPRLSRGENGSGTGYVGRHCWSKSTISRRRYNGLVYSIEVEGHHNYFADGILTHNSFISASDAMDAIDTCHQAALTQSFRFGDRIAEVANLYLETLGADVTMRGLSSLDSTVESLARPDTILCRTNAAVIAAALNGLQDGRKVAVVGGVDELVSFAESAAALQNGLHATDPQLACFATWHEVVDFVQNDPNGDDLKLLVKLIDEFGADDIAAAMKRTTSERSADLVVSTAHKSKGRQWGRVRVAAGFAEPDDVTGELPSDEDLRLQYVAATRAQSVLDPEGLFLANGSGKRMLVDEVDSEFRFGMSPA